MSQDISKNLTKYAKGSLGELWYIVLPLILTSLCTALTLFVDRIVLSNYTLDAINAVATAGTVFAVLQYGALAISGIAEVFVGQYNGAQKYHRIGEPVWQMIWFGVLCWIVFIPFAWFIAPHILPSNYQEGLPYLRILCLLGPVFPIYIALSAFFVGRGKTRLVLIVNIVINALNILLDIILVFGIEGIVPAMGIKGAAIATVLSHIAGIMILARIFLNSRSRAKYGTSNFSFKLEPFMQCLRIGVPSSVGLVLEIAAWAFLFKVMAQTSEEHITVFAVGQSVMLLFFAVIEGMHRGSIAIVSNLIGAEEKEKVTEFLLSAMKLVLILSLAIAIPLVIFPQSVVSLFFMTQGQPEHMMGISESISVSMVWLYLVIVVNLVMWVIAGILIAGGDTKFVMYMRALCGWVFTVTPVYIYLYYFNGTAEGSWKIAFLGELLVLLCFYLRYRQNKWQQIEVMKPELEGV